MSRFQLDLCATGRAGSSTHRRRSWQGKEDRSAFPDRALDPHASAVGLDDASNDREAEPRSASVDFPLRRLAVEEMWKRSCVYPAAGVRDPKQDVAIVRLCSDRDGAPVRCEPLRVADQILEHLNE